MRHRVREIEKKGLLATGFNERHCPAVPSGTTLSIQLRSASTSAAVVTADWRGPHEGAAEYSVTPSEVNPIHDGDQFVQVRVLMTSDRGATPQLESVSLAYTDADATGSEASPVLGRAILESVAAYPNPFANSLSLQIDLQARARITASVTDLVGRRLAIIVDEVLESGTHTAEWGGAQADGVYILRVAAGRESMTMIVVGIGR